MIKHCIIADLHIVIDTDDRDLLNALAPKYAPFCHRASDCAEVPVLFSLHHVEPFEALADTKLIVEFDCQGYWCKYEQKENIIQISMQDLQTRENIAQMQCTDDFSEARCWIRNDQILYHREFFYNNYLMMLYSFSSMNKKTLVFHASVVARENKAYLFLAKSGTGKSTHSTLWLKHVPGCQLVNDDNPVVGIRDNKVYVYGSPWSGKTDCYRNMRVEVGGFARINHAPDNHLDRQSPVASFALLLPSCSGVKWDKTLYRSMCDTISDIVGRIPVYELHCTPYKEAAVVCSTSIGAWDGVSEGEGFGVNEKSLKPAGVTLPAPKE